MHGSQLNGRIACVIFFLSACVSPPSLGHSDHDNTESTEDIVGQKPKWQGNLEAGFIATTGNSESEVFNGAFNILHHKSQWTHALYAAASGSAFNGKRNTESYSVNGTVKRDIKDKQFLFATVRLFDDKFDSFSQSSSAAVGAGFQPMVTSKLSWDVFAGIGYSHQRLEESDKDISGVTFLGISQYSHQLTETTHLDFVSSIEYKPENTFARNEASLDVAINSTLALKFAYEMRYNSSPASLDKNLDTITKANIVYKF